VGRKLLIAPKGRHQKKAENHRAEAKAGKRRDYSTQTIKA
jgi:hypothetical protein